MELDVTDEITKQIEKIVIRDEEGQVLNYPKSRTKKCCSNGRS